jgi:hypothetical protein
MADRPAGTATRNLRPSIVASHSTGYQEARVPAVAQDCVGSLIILSAAGWTT